MSESLYNKLKDINDSEKELSAKKAMLIEKSLSNPSSPKDVVFATKLLNEQNQSIKAYLIDPMNSHDGGDYRTRSFFDVSFGTLRNMAKNTGLISAIIGTRKEQVASYSGYSTEDVKPGWKIEKNINNYFDDIDEYKNAKKLDFIDKKEIKKIINFIENCGIKNKLYHGDDFDSFLRKFVDDSLTLDQACFEIVPSKFLKPYEFFMVDGATIRYASPLLKDQTDKINGYYPYAVQLYQESVYTNFYPWELCIGIRNPTTNILYNGYGISELELLIKTVTYILYSESYTGKFFSQGSNPKGLFIAKGNLSEDKLQEFRQSWKSQVTGLSGAHKIPILSGPDLQWVDMQKSNEDMEFSNWLDYLARICFAIFKIDGKELGYNVSSESNVNYDSSIQEKLTYSKEKGLVPLLRFIEKQLNKYIVYPLSNFKYKFSFTGVDNSEKIIEQLDLDRVEKGVMSFSEYRIKHNLSPKLNEDDFLLNSTWIQYKQMMMGAQQQQQLSLQQQQQSQQDNLNEQQEEVNNEKEENKNIFSDFVKDNPFAKDLNNFAIEKGFK